MIQTRFRLPPKHVFAFLLAVLCCSSKLSSTPQTLADDAIASHLDAARQAEQTHNYAEASRHYQEILQTSPNLALIHQSLAVTYHLQNLFPQAIDEFQRALRLDPTLFGSYLFLGMDFYKSNEFKLAIPPLEQSTSRKDVKLHAAVTHNPKPVADRFAQKLG
jgi:tetratricopeptide (TPR) repeat protein